MMRAAPLDCARIAALHALYQDGELHALDAAAVDAHLAGCPACAGAVQRARASHRALRAALTYHRPSAEQTARWLRHAPVDLAPAVVRPQARTARRTLASLAGGAVIGAALTYALLRPDAGPAAESLIADAHVRALATDRLVDVASTERHTVKPWFAGKVAFAPDVPDLAASDFTLAGGRIDSLADRTVAALVYRRRKHVVQVFVWPESERGIATPRVDIVRGFNLVAWTHAGLRYAAISDLNAQELAELAALFQAPR